MARLNAATQGVKRLGGCPGIEQVGCQPIELLFRLFAWTRTAAIARDLSAEQPLQAGLSGLQRVVAYLGRPL